MLTQVDIDWASDSAVECADSINDWINLGESEEAKAEVERMPEYWRKVFDVSSEYADAAEGEAISNEIYNEFVKRFDSEVPSEYRINKQGKLFEAAKEVDPIGASGYLYRNGYKTKEQFELTYGFNPLKYPKYFELTKGGLVWATEAYNDFVVSEFKNHKKDSDMMTEKRFVRETESSDVYDIKGSSEEISEIDFEKRTVNTWAVLYSTNHYGPDIEIEGTILGVNTGRMIDYRFEVEDLDDASEAVFDDNQDEIESFILDAFDDYMAAKRTTSMKMPPEDFEALKKAILDLAKEYPEEIAQHKANHTAKRFAWDLFHKVDYNGGSGTKFSTKFYNEGLNDSHIETALLRITKDI